jgi:hydrogenase maturation protein HypF
MGEDTSLVKKEEGKQRLRALIQGAVQGVGFRPFVFRLAAEMGLAGWVLNSAQGVFLEIEGDKPSLDSFLLRLQNEKPPQARIWSLEFSFLRPVGYERFEIRRSEDGGEKTASVLPEIAACQDCLSEILDPEDRHFLYPFTNCTNCGPRFTIIRELPYDRANTSMAAFLMCEDCRREYENPRDRRFHAQPTACPACGPALELRDERGESLAKGKAALLKAAQAVREGRILALKGLGGFLLMVDARSEEAVKRLRERKLREEKPFALLMASLEQVKEHCQVSPLEERLLLSPESPILLLARREESAIAPAVAPGNPNLGVMLPYSPLHHLLMREAGFPVVATSGNRTDEPIVTDEKEALERLKGIADLFLVHNRPILRHCDDSVVRILLGREMVMRRARGYAPLPIHVKKRLPAILAVGAHLKNTIALSSGERVIISQHIGDLETPQAYRAFLAAVEDLQRLYDIKPEAAACDMHPDYLSSKYARSLGLPLVEVQHHHAHLASCLAENEVEGPALGICWDGTGYGPDGSLWGSEFLIGDYAGCERAAHFLPLALPGGEKAIREPKRIALSMLYSLFGKVALERDDLEAVRNFTGAQREALLQMLQKGINSPLSCGIGRLFDGAAALIGLRQKATFEGQPAMELEFIADGQETSSYPFEIMEGKPLAADWRPIISAIIDDLNHGLPKEIIARRFHNSLIEAAVEIASRLQIAKIVLSGGVFQNRILAEGIFQRLTERGFEVHLHQRVPPNDGGISLGQAMAAAAQLEAGSVNSRTGG